MNTLKALWSILLAGFGAKCMWCGARKPHGEPTDWGPRNEENKNWCRKCGRVT
jgi:hypothetical protein